MTKAIYFDMDGTLADLYGVDNWLDYLVSERTKPYREAKPLVNMRQLGSLLNKLQEQGWTIGIISWLSKSGSEDYGERVTKTKMDWLDRHIGAVEWDEIRIVPHGMPKALMVTYPTGILFDDEEQNRDNWLGNAFDVDNILQVLADLLD